MVLTNEEKLELKIQVKAIPYPFLLTRQTEIQSRLSSIGIHHDDDTTNNNNIDNNNKKANNNNESTPLLIPTRVPTIPKTDTHWDFVMKELAWLATDFQSERKRQTSLAKKQALSVQLGQTISLHKRKTSPSQNCRIGTQEAKACFQVGQLRNRFT